MVKEGKSILLITSRQITADSQAEKLGGSRHIDPNSLSEIGSEKNTQNITVVTNSGIEKFLKEKYDPENANTHIWNYYDLIILDEAHSIVSDATFADSTFHVICFFSYIIHYTDKKVIFMSGTPQSIQNLFSEKTTESSEYIFLDFYDQCIHVDPETVVLYYTSGIEHIMKQYMEDGYKSIYFANSITRIETLVSSLISIGVSKDVIGISYSSEDEKEFPSEISACKKIIESSLKVDERLPDNIKIFISTTRNKEGVNIHNDDIKLMFSEAKDRTSLIQMAGRVRKGLEYFVILYDAPQHPQSFTAEEIELGWYCKEGVNAFWDFWKTSNQIQMDQKIIKMIEKKFPGLRYDYLSDKFRDHIGKEQIYDLTHADSSFINQCVNRYKNGKRTVVDIDGNILEYSGEALLNTWFPYSYTQLTPAMNSEEQTTTLSGLIEHYLIENNHLSSTFDKLSKQRLLDALNGLLENQKDIIDYSKIGFKLPAKQLNRILKIAGYCMDELPGHRKGTAFHIVKME